jgi:hypothetical protein
MKRLNYIFYRDQDRYLFTTGRSPRKFEGVLFVMWEGATPDSLTEGVRAVNQLKALVRVEPRDVPDEWWTAFVGVDQNLSPRPSPKVVQETPPAYHEDFQAQPRYNRVATRKLSDKPTNKIHALWPIGLALTVAMCLAWLLGMLR